MQIKSDGSGKGGFEAAITELKQVYSVDDLIEAGAITALDHVKIDVDGHEQGILQGMQRTLQSPTGPKSLSVEVYAGDVEPITELMQACGYVANSENYSRTESKKMRKDPSYEPSCRNIIFCRVAG